VTKIVFHDRVFVGLPGTAVPLMEEVPAVDVIDLAIAIVVAAMRGQTWAIPFLAIYAGGFGLVAGLSIWQARPVHKKRGSEIPASRSLSSEGGLGLHPRRHKGARIVRNPL
jgi:hypothetical protein